MGTPVDNQERGNHAHYVNKIVELIAELILTQFSSCTVPAPPLIYATRASSASSLSTARLSSDWPAYEDVAGSSHASAHTTFTTPTQSPIVSTPMPTIQRQHNHDITQSHQDCEKPTPSAPPLSNSPAEPSVPSQSYRPTTVISINHHRSNKFDAETPNYAHIKPLRPGLCFRLVLAAMYLAPVVGAVALLMLMRICSPPTPDVLYHSYFQDNPDVNNLKTNTMSPDPAPQPYPQPPIDPVDIVPPFATGEKASTSTISTASIGAATVSCEALDFLSRMTNAVHDYSAHEECNTGNDLSVYFPFLPTSVYSYDAASFRSRFPKVRINDAELMHIIEQQLVDDRLIQMPALTSHNGDDSRRQVTWHEYQENSLDWEQKAMLWSCFDQGVTAIKSAPYYFKIRVNTNPQSMPPETTFVSDLPPHCLVSRALRMFFSLLWSGLALFFVVSIVHTILGAIRQRRLDKQIEAGVALLTKLAQAEQKQNDKEWCNAVWEIYNPSYPHMFEAVWLRMTCKRPAS
eukprot:TRINITY_DN5529_c0_g1_i2.p1 TRINITY_DN5529_c0_g1~~TRINITY_DN5529_c0_g1_i2.p1  ORF type:complete len:571 (-),score=55.63 TRINITY_DN5529_c0_g1_i2:12-1562(-)